MLATEKGKAFALEQLAIRRESKPERIDNSSLVAGSPMYYYCRTCGHESDVLPECHNSKPRKLCRECEALKDAGWLE